MVVVENEIDEVCFVNFNFERMRFLINGCDGSGEKHAWGGFWVVGCRQILAKWVSFGGVGCTSHDHNTFWILTKKMTW